jgi:hypothetical protein
VCPLARVPRQPRAHLTPRPPAAPITDWPSARLPRPSSQACERLGRTSEVELSREIDRELLLPALQALEARVTALQLPADSGTPPPPPTQQQGAAPPSEPASQPAAATSPAAPPTPTKSPSKSRSLLRTRGASPSPSEGEAQADSLAALRQRAETAEAQVRSLESELLTSWEDMQSQLAARDARIAHIEEERLQEKAEWLREKAALHSQLSARGSHRASAPAATSSRKPHMIFHFW